MGIFQFIHPCHLCLHVYVRNGIIILWLGGISVGGILMQTIPIANFYLNPKAIYKIPTPLNLMRKNKKKHKPAPRSTAAATVVYRPPGMVCRRNRAGAGRSGRGKTYHCSCMVYHSQGAANRRQRHGRARGAADWSCEWANGSGLRVEGDRL
jgi:hypothetical protein